MSSHLSSLHVFSVFCSQHLSDNGPREDYYSAVEAYSARWTSCSRVMCFPSHSLATPDRVSSHMVQRQAKSEYYLKTRSEAWLDLEPSQLWCFSWVLASFSAAAIGHPDRLKMTERSQWHRGTYIWAPFSVRMVQWMHEPQNTWLVRAPVSQRASLKRMSAHLPVGQSIPVSTSLNKPDDRKAFNSTTFNSFGKKLDNSLCVSGWTAWINSQNRHSHMGKCAFLCASCVRQTRTAGTHTLTCTQDLQSVSTESRMPHFR